MPVGGFTATDYPHWNFYHMDKINRLHGFSGNMKIIKIFVVLFSNALYLSLQFLIFLLFPLIFLIN